MINLYEVTETNKMIEEENLDVRTITLGISLLDCIDSDLQAVNDKIYRKIYEAARDLVETGEKISREFGIPIVDKENFRNAHCTGRRSSLQDCRRFCEHRKDAGQGCP